MSTKYAHQTPEEMPLERVMRIPKTFFAINERQEAFPPSPQRGFLALRGPESLLAGRTWPIRALISHFPRSPLPNSATIEIPHPNFPFQQFVYLSQKLMSMRAKQYFVLFIYPPLTHSLSTQ